MDPLCDDLAIFLAFKFVNSTVGFNLFHMGRFFLLWAVRIYLNTRTFPKFWKKLHIEDSETRSSYREKDLITERFSRNMLQKSMKV